MKYYVKKYQEPYEPLNKNYPEEVMKYWWEGDYEGFEKAKQEYDNYYGKILPEVEVSPSQVVEDKVFKNDGTFESVQQKDWTSEHNQQHEWEEYKRKHGHYPSNIITYNPVKAFRFEQDARRNANFYGSLITPILVGVAGTGIMQGAGVADDIVSGLNQGSKYITPKISKGLNYVNKIFQPSKWLNPVTGKKLLTNTAGVIADGAVDAAFAELSANELYKGYKQDNITLDHVTNAILDASPIIVKSVNKLINGVQNINSGIKQVMKKTKTDLQETFPNREYFKDKPTRILINSKTSSAKNAYNDAMQTGIIRPSENIKTHNNELYFTNNGVYGKPKKGEYIIVPKENVTFSNTLNKHINFKTPDNILTENFNFYTPTIFGRFRKIKTNPIKLIDQDVTSIKWDVDPRTDLGKQFLRDLHFKKASPNNIFNDQVFVHSTNATFNTFDKKFFGITDDGYHGKGFYFSTTRPASELAKQSGVSLGPHGEMPTMNYGKNKMYVYLKGVPSEAKTSTYNYFNQPDELGVVLTKGTIYKPVIAEIITGNSNNIKLSNAITYDDFGNIIPLSKRDNFNISDVRYKQGGSIHIKEKNKGKFTEAAKRAGKSVQEHARDVVNNPKATKLQKKRAQFALNAKKFKHG